MSKGTCGDPDCILPSNHGGDLHVGRRHDGNRADMWPMKHAREAAAKRGITGRFVGQLPPSEDREEPSP